MPWQSHQGIRNLGNPEAPNLYAIVHDNPETFADLDGHYGEDNNPGAATNPNSAAQKKPKKNPKKNPPPKPKKTAAQRAREYYQRASAEYRAWVAQHQTLVNAVVLGASIAIAIASKGKDAEGLQGLGEGGEAGEAPGPGQFKRLSAREIKELEKNGVDVHELKGRRGGGELDLFKDRNGDIFIKPKSGTGPGEPTGINIKNLEVTFD